MSHKEEINKFFMDLNNRLLFGEIKSNGHYYSKEELALHYKRLNDRRETFTWYFVKIGNVVVKSCQSNKTGIFYKIKNYNERVMRYYSKVEIIRPLTKWDW